MLFHMLRSELGDAAFLEALRGFYRSHVFTRATFADLGAAFQARTTRDLGPVLAAWTGRTGAPLLRVVSEKTAADGAGGTVTTVELAQEQPEEPFPLAVPLALTCAGTDSPVAGTAVFAGRTATAELRCAGQPLRLDVDPRFDVMRRLDPLEVAPSLSTLLGDDAPLYVLPTLASEEERATWRELARAWQKGKGEPRFVGDAAKELPGGNAWALGWGNAPRPGGRGRPGPTGCGAVPEGVAVAGRGVARAGESLLLVARRPGDPSGPSPG